jgi:hypothetical protein
MLALLISALIGQPLGYGPAQAAQPESYYQKCMNLHHGPSRETKCACLANFLETNPNDPRATEIAFNLMFQYYQPSFWELESAYGVDAGVAGEAGRIKIAANKVCYFSPKYPEGGLQE